MTVLRHRSPLTGDCPRTFQVNRNRVTQLVVMLASPDKGAVATGLIDRGRLWAAFEHRHINEVVRRRLNYAADVMVLKQLDEIGGGHFRQQNGEA